MNQQKRITLKRKYFQSFVVVAPSWVSNGFWAVRRPLAKRAELIATKELAAAWLGDVRWVEKTDADISRFFAGDRKPFQVTRIGTTHYHHRSLCLVADGDAAFINPAFLDLFGIYAGATLYAKDGLSPLSDGETEADSSVVFMPKKMEDLAEIRAQLTRWAMEPASVAK